MNINLGSSAALLRLGSGSPSKVFIGSVAVQNVPGKPAIQAAVFDLFAGISSIFINNPLSGGSPLTGYRLFLNNEEFDLTQAVAVGGLSAPEGFIQVSGDRRFQDAEVVAINAIGEGPKSDPATIGG